GTANVVRVLSAAIEIAAEPVEEPDPELTPPDFIQKSGLYAQWGQTGAKSVTFSSGVSAGSLIVVQAAASPNWPNTDPPEEIITAVAMTGVTFGEPYIEGYAMVWLGRVTSGGATQLDFTLSGTERHAILIAS